MIVNSKAIYNNFRRIESSQDFKERMIIKIRESNIKSIKTFCNYVGIQEDSFSLVGWTKEKDESSVLLLLEDCKNIYEEAPSEFTNNLRRCYGLNKKDVIIFNQIIIPMMDLRL